MTMIGAVVIAFFIGSIPTSYLVVRLRIGKDIRSLGSGNPGATNVFRAVGRREGIAVLAIDILKGALAVLLLSEIWADPPLNFERFQLIIGLFSVLGHVFCPFLRFRGGKGVATSAGAIAVIYPFHFLVAFSVWLSTLIVLRYMSVASILSAYAFALAALVSFNDPIQKGIAFIAAAFITWTHRSNLKRLQSGTETRFSVRSRNS